MFFISKNIQYFFLISCFFNIFKVSADVCATANGLTILTEEYINVLASNNCTALDAILNDGVITISSNITSLENLTAINRIWGNLTISNNDHLKTLHGLHNLIQIIGDLTIEDNNLLSNLTGLTSLTKLNNFVINQNPNLENLNGLGTLAIGGDFTVSLNSKLQSLEGIEGSKLQNGANIAIIGNPMLQNLNEMTNISYYLNTLQVLDNDALENVDGLMDILETNITIIKNNTNLQDIHGLLSLKTIGQFQIRNNTSLKNIYGLSAVTFLTRFTLLELPSFDCSNDCNSVIIHKLTNISFINANTVCSGNPNPSSSVKPYNCATRLLCLRCNSTLDSTSTSSSSTSSSTSTSTSSSTSSTTFVSGSISTSTSTSSSTSSSTVSSTTSTTSSLTSFSLDSVINSFTSDLSRYFSSSTLNVLQTSDSETSISTTQNQIFQIIDENIFFDVPVILSPNSSITVFIDDNIGKIISTENIEINGDLKLDLSNLTDDQINQINSDIGLKIEIFNSKKNISGQFNSIELQNNNNDCELDQNYEPKQIQEKNQNGDTKFSVIFQTDYNCQEKQNGLHIAEVIAIVISVLIVLVFVTLVLLLLTYKYHNEPENMKD